MNICAKAVPMSVVWLALTGSNSKLLPIKLPGEILS